MTNNSHRSCRRAFPVRGSSTCENIPENPSIPLASIPNRGLPGNPSLLSLQTIFPNAIPLSEGVEIRRRARLEGGDATDRAYEERARFAATMKRVCAEPVVSRSRAAEAPEAGAGKRA